MEKDQFLERLPRVGSTTHEAKWELDWVKKDRFDCETFGDGAQLLTGWPTRGVIASDKDGLAKRTATQEAYWRSVVAKTTRPGTARLWKPVLWEGLPLVFHITSRDFDLPVLRQFVEDMLEAQAKKDEANQGLKLTQWAKISAEARPLNGNFVAISSNLFGWFDTWIAKDDLVRLARAQTGSSPNSQVNPEWKRPLPNGIDGSDAADLQQKMSDNLELRGPKGKEYLAILQGAPKNLATNLRDLTGWGDRIDASKIMGNESANEVCHSLRDSSP